MAIKISALRRMLSQVIPEQFESLPNQNLACRNHSSYENSLRTIVSSVTSFKKKVSEITKITSSKTNSQTILIERTKTRSVQSSVNTYKVKEDEQYNNTNANDHLVVIDKDNILPPKNNSFILMSSTKSRYRVLYSEFKQTTKMRSYFIVLSIFRQMIYSLIICFCFNKPFEGLLLAISLNILFLICLIFVNPFTDIKEYINTLLNELCGISAFIFAFCMQYMDENDIIDEELKINFGWGIVFINILLAGFFL